MKKQYQIEQQRAVRQFRRLAVEQNPNIQMILPMADIVGLLQEGVGNLLRHAGLELMQLVMDEEVKSLAGERHQQHQGPTGTAAGKLRIVSAQRADAGGRVGQDDVRTVDAQLRSGGEGVPASLRHREISGKRELHRG